MASKRCGCASDSCSCVIEAGAGVAISGTGSKNNPYTIDAIPNATDLSVQDENTVIRTGVTLLDFVGGGVTATAGDTGEVIVTVPTPPASGLGGITVTAQVFSASGTWTKPANLLWSAVELVGGGGAGGGAAATSTGQSAAGSGGGGGGYARKVFVASALAASVAVTVGAAGAPGAAGSNPGGNGGTSSFGAVSATGGTGGVGMGSTALTTVSGGVGGTATGGDLNVTGGRGGPGRVIGGVPVQSAEGGNSQLGQGGGAAASGNTAGFAGQDYGGGGAGAVNRDTAGGSAMAGGAGGAGVVIVTSYIKQVSVVGVEAAILTPVAAGRVTVPLTNMSTASAAVTFPSDRFSTVPVAVATLNSGDPYLIGKALNVTIGGMTVVVFHRDSANITTDCVVSWVAREVG